MNLRRMTWRLGRKLYTHARGERLNIVSANGEMAVQAAVLAACRKAGRPCLAVDVGANQGEWTLAMTRQAGAQPLCIHAFEPVPGTRALLSAAVAAAGQEGRVRIHGLGLSDQAGRRTMHHAGDGLGTNSLEADSHAASVAVALTVETQTLAGFAEAQGLSALDLVKVDTEGHDSLVIAGAAPLLAKGAIAALQFEYNHRWIFARRYLKDVFDLIADLKAPYRIGLVGPRGIDLFPGWHPELERFFEANYLLIRNDAASWFSAHAGAFDGSNTYA